MGLFARIKAALERKQQQVPIWTPLGHAGVTLPDPTVYHDPIFIAARLEDVNVDVFPLEDKTRPTINGVLVFVVPKNEMACFLSDGKNYFAHLGAERWI